MQPWQAVQVEKLPQSWHVVQFGVPMQAPTPASDALQPSQLLHPNAWPHVPQFASEGVPTQVPGVSHPRQPVQPVLTWHWAQLA